MEKIKRKLPIIITILCFIIYAGLYLILPMFDDWEPTLMNSSYLAMQMPLYFTLVYLYECKFGKLRMNHHFYFKSFPITRKKLIHKEFNQLLADLKYQTIFLCGFFFIVLTVQLTKFELLTFSVLYLLNFLFIAAILVMIRYLSYNDDTQLVANFFFLNFYFSFTPIFLDNLNLGIYNPFGAMYLAPLVYDYFPLNILPIIQVSIVVILYSISSKRIRSWVANT